VLPPPTSAFKRFSSRVSLIAVALLAGSILSGLAAWWTGKYDFVSFLERRIGAARGATAGDSLERFRNFDLSGTLIVIAVIFGLAALLAQRFVRPVLQRLLDSKALRAAFARPWMMPTACGIIVLALYHSTLSHGYFRFDDFDFLVVAHDHPLREAIWKPHGDHFYPLSRVLTSIAVHFFGTTAWPYNLGVLLCFWGVTYLGCRLLAEMSVSPVGQWVFAALLLLWSPWAEMLGGYYILSAYLLVALLGLASVLCYQRWRKTARKLPAIGVAFCVAAAPLVDTSGWYVPAAFAVFLAADWLTTIDTIPLRTWLAQHVRLMLAVGVGVALNLAITILCYTVMNPGLFLSMSGSTPRTLGRLVQDFFYLLDVGLLVSMVVPFVYARLPLVVLVALAIFVSVVFTAFVIYIVLHARRRQRIALVAIALVIAGSALMVNLGRPSGETIVVRWSAKHVCPAYVWLCLLCALGWHIAWTRSTEVRRVIFLEATLILVCMFGIAQTAFGAIGLAVSFPPFGYPAEIRDGDTRRHNVDQLKRDIVARIKAAAGQPITVPTLDGAYINTKYPSLFDYNLAHYFPIIDERGRDIDWVRNSAMQAWSGPRVRSVPQIRPAVSPTFIQLLEKDPLLREYYFAPIPLRLQPSSSAIAAITPPDPAHVIAGIGRREADGSIIVESNGNTRLTLHVPDFDPESLPFLKLAIEAERRDQSHDITLGVALRSQFNVSELRGTLKLPNGEKNTKSVDLRQIYAFALSQTVSEVRIIFGEPGTYRVRVAELSP
jgi:hypothetical protein